VNASKTRNKNQKTESLSNTPPSSITRRGKVADALKAHPTYFLLRNAAVRHSHIIQAIAPIDNEVMDQLVESAISEALIASRKNWRVATLKAKVRQAVDRLVDREKKIVHLSDPANDFDPLTPSAPCTITPDSIPDPRDYELLVIDKIDRDRARARLQQKVLDVLGVAELNFMYWYLSLDRHDPPCNGAERARFMRLKQRLHDHLGDFDSTGLNS
jgi:hypothetical protein